jgi:hypothetical protein
MQRSSPKKLNEDEGKEQYHIEVSKRFVALDILDSEVEINSAREMTRGSIKISTEESVGYFELEKPWFDKECSELLDLRKQAKLQWLQNRSEINGDNLNNVRSEAIRYFRNKK